MNVLAISLYGKQQSEFHLTGIRCKRIIICSLFLLLLLIPILAVSAQTMEDTDRLYEKGSILLSRGDYTKALEKLYNSAQIYLDLDAAQESIDSLNKTGECFLMLGSYEEALEIYLLALSLAEMFGGREEEAFIQSYIGLTYSNLQNYEMAFSYYNDALRYFTKIRDLEGMALVQGSLAVAYDDSDRIDEAIIQYLKAISLFEQLSDNAQVADTLHSMGLAYENLGQFQQAADSYMRAAEINADLGLKSQEEHMVYKHGIMQMELGNSDEARKSLQIALDINIELQNQYETADILIQLGEFERSLGNNRNALESFEQAYEIAEKNDDFWHIGSSLNYMGIIYQYWGRFDDALRSYEESLDWAREMNSPESIAFCYMQIGSLYQSWGSYDRSLEFYEKALAIYRKQKNKIGIGLTLGFMANNFTSTNQIEKACQYTEEAISIYESLGNHEAVAVLYNNLGDTHISMGDFDQAIKYFEKSLELSATFGFNSNMAAVFGNLGSAYSLGKSDDEAAIEYFMKALAVSEEFEFLENIATVLNNIGVSYRNMENYDKAITFLNRSIDIKETLRITAEGALRRDYLASQLQTYQNLCSIHIKNGNPSKAFETAELSAAKYLIDQLSTGLDKSILSSDPVGTYLDRTTGDSLVISFANVSNDEGIARFNADKNHIDALELPLKSFLDTINNKHGSRISEDLFYLDLKNQLDESGTATFEEIINYYRYLLTAYSPGSDEKEILYDIETSLYEFLFSGLEKTLHGKDEILIIPGGILAFIPFEALRMPDDRYLVERFNIRYAQSLSVLNTLENRQYDSSSKEPLLAFGGAVYDEQSYEKSIVKSEKQLEAVIQSTLQDLDRGLNVEETYQMLGVGSWDNLPGTIAEVQAIGSIVPGSTIYTGERVNEAFVKSLSTRGVLKDYRVLHFATHGLVVPEIPELSAVVLSLTDDMGSEEDGYLRMGEIAGLEIEADFVNLSACETGLGKIYGGEGVVGLTQSFLVAGANGLSVSLWQVSDESTMEFMTGVYRLVTEQGIDYDLAMTEMKRRFIADGQYSEPFYWAPFVYYGK